MWPPRPAPPCELSSWQKDLTEGSLSPEPGPDRRAQNKEWSRPTVLPLTSSNPNNPASQVLVSFFRQETEAGRDVTCPASKRGSPGHRGHIQPGPQPRSQPPPHPQPEVGPTRMAARAPLSGPLSSGSPCCWGRGITSQPRRRPSWPRFQQVRGLRMGVGQG